MPLNRLALSLGAGPRSVQEARRWVVETFTEIGREDLLECAELGVSELVTNALLHAVPPIRVQVRGTHEHPRIEVRDGSIDPPVMTIAEASDEIDDLLLTFGRGLSIVARASDAWGTMLEDDGKTVWFAPARGFSDDDGPAGTLSGAADGDSTPPDAEAEVHLLGVPVADYLAFHRHFRELRREVGLLTLAHAGDYPLARDLSAHFDTLGRELSLSVGHPDITAAIDAGREVTDVHLRVPDDVAGAVARFGELLDLTDEFCRQERMLSLARTPHERDFQTWFLGEVVRQLRGERPRAWSTASGRECASAH
ncbi:ATP-binding protein [Nocardioides sp. R-C-SC26]|uniref:ATP-binding protein n=1 Tax=Nocardioides sp. R-C-SC26 TaxID=2870414 RepID=UPI001E32032C|nr:ATP-binding protein [Nocardioides sp. R-C-SC26]